MKRRKVRLSPTALEDLRAIGRWISEQGAPMTAVRYVRNVRRFLAGFSVASERGMLRDDLASGTRIANYRGWVIVAFRVHPDHVMILRLFHGGQDWEAALRRQPSDLEQTEH